MPARPILRLVNTGFFMFISLAIVNALGNYALPSVKYSYWIAVGIVLALWLARSAMYKFKGTPLFSLINKCKMERPVSWTQTLLHNSWILLALIPTIGLPLMVVAGLVLFGSMWLRADRRGFHDLFAETTVVRA